MTRRVGFGDDDPRGSGGGWFWAALAALVFLAVVLAAVLDPDLTRRLSAWVNAPAERPGWLLPMLGIGAFLAIALTLRRIVGARRPNAGDGAETRRAPSMRGNEPRPVKARPIKTSSPALRTGGETSTVAAPQQNKPAPDRVLGAFGAIFLVVWLCAWTAGIVFAIGAFMSELGGGFGPQLFLLVWIVFALIGWVVAFGMLIGFIRGFFRGR